MLSFNIPKEKKVRVILSTDLKNEVDDQFAMVHAVLTESFDLKAVIPSHFGTEKSYRCCFRNYHRAENL